MTDLEFELLKAAGILVPGAEIRVKNDRLNPKPFAGHVVKILKVSRKRLLVNYADECMSESLYIDLNDVDLTYRKTE